MIIVTIRRGDIVKLGECGSTLAVDAGHEGPTLGCCEKCRCVEPLRPYEGQEVCGFCGDALAWLAGVQEAKARAERARFAKRRVA